MSTTATMTELDALERWALFEHADGFLTFHYTDCGSVSLTCGGEASIPSDFITPCAACAEMEAGGVSGVLTMPIERLRYLKDACSCPQTGWLGEFTTGAVKVDSDFPGTHGAHYTAFALDFLGCVGALYTALLTNQPHACPRAVPASGTDGQGDGR